MLALISVSACQDRPPAVSAAPAAGIAIQAGFVKSRDDQLIEVTAQDRLAITAATLVMADGSKTPAESIDAVADPSESTDRALDPGNAGVTGSFDRPLNGAMTETTTLIGQIASAAHIRVAFPADYAAGWHGAHIEVTFGRGGGAFTQSVAAPPPP
jgi:hypothetical protein